ncbi:MAG: hypothetical protein K2Q20_12805 [Phycisphaerales bacterium]|nr:hypothetical protein [Phycisphaerales bacterium]
MDGRLNEQRVHEHKEQRMIWIVIAGVLGLIFVAVMMQTYRDSVAERSGGVPPRRGDSRSSGSDASGTTGTHDSLSPFQMGVMFGAMDSGSPHAPSTPAEHHGQHHAHPTDHGHGHHHHDSGGGGGFDFGSGDSGGGGGDGGGGGGGDGGGGGGGGD